jgi:benzoate-CoA ligase
MTLVQTLADMPVRYNATIDLLEGNLEAGRGGKVAYIDGRGSWTYAQLSERVDRVGGLLKTLGVEREQRVMVCLQDDIDFPTVFLGAMKAGVVPVAVNTLFTSDVYAFQLRDSRARVAFVSAALADKFAPLLDQCPDLKAIIITGSEPDQLEARLAASEPIAAAADTCRDEPAFWLYTSGSTGDPKGVVHSHGSLRITADLYGRPVAGFTESDTVYSVAKLFFAYGLGNSLTFPLSVGATVVLLADRPTPAVCSDILRRHGVSILCGSPTFFAGLLDYAQCPTKDEVPNLRAATSAGEALPEAIAERFLARFGVWILDGLGSTEMLHIFISQLPGATKAGCTGKPVPGYEARIVDEAGEVVGDNVLGELQVRGPSAALSYWNNRPKSQHTFMGHWTRTGDKYIRDSEGFYRYGGRNDDMLKVSGIYVSPFDVEEALIGHPAVLEAGVVGWADKDGLIKPKAFVVLAAGVTEPMEQLEASLRAHVKSVVAPHAYPRWIEVVAELPKTSTGKIQRFKLRALQITS